MKKIKKDIDFIFAHFSFLPAFILKLEREKVRLSDALPVVDHFRTLLQESAKTAPKDKKKDAQKIAAKFQHCLDDNTGLARLREAIKLAPDCHLEFTQITSALTERLFGWYRRYFEDRSGNLNGETLEQTTACKLALRRTFCSQRRTNLQTYNPEYQPVTLKLRKLVDCVEGLDEDSNIGAQAKKLIRAHQTKVSKQATKQSQQTRRRLKRL